MATVVRTSERSVDIASSDGDRSRPRVLTITGHALGWRTYASSLQAATDASAVDVDALHVLVDFPWLFERAGARIPGLRGGWFDSHFRRVALGQHHVRRWLTRHVDVTSFDVMHITPQFIAPGAIAVVPHSLPIAVGIDATGVQAKMLTAGITEGVARRRHRRLLAMEERAFGRADLIVGMSEWSVSALDPAMCSKAVVVPPSLPLRPHAGTTATPGRVRVAWVGNDWTRKGGDRLVAWHQAHFADAIDLHICGSGPPAGARTDGITWHGHVPHDTLVGDLLPSMDLFVFPTRSDMSPWAVLEAVSLGVPALTSDVGGIREMVTDDVNGLLVEPHDDDGFVAALRRLVDEPDALRRLADGARRLALARDHGAGLRRYVDHWLELAARGRGQP